MLSYETKADDSACRCSTFEEFEDWCKDGGWKDTMDFYRDTRVEYETIEGKWFSVIHNRVYIEGED